LEEACELGLFRKKKGHIYLTDEGKTVFRYASKIFELERELEQAIDDLRKIRKGYLHLGTSKTYARYLMPTLLAAFHKFFPDITIELNEGSSLDITQSLLDFRNLVAIIAKAEDNPNIEFIPFIREEVVLIASPDYHLTTKREEITIEDLLREPLIMREVGSETRKVVEEAFKRTRQKPNIIVETSNTEFIKELVKQKVGISFIVKIAVSRELNEGEVVALPIRKHKLFLDSYIAYLRDYNLPPVVKAFTGFLKNLIGKKKPPLKFSPLMAEILRT
jgi:DNA-binding transcriptional LysR family regulator